MFAPDHALRVRRLYKLIFRVHRALPPELRVLGDNYARDEFKRHKACNVTEAQVFLNEWTFRKWLRERTEKEHVELWRIEPKCRQAKEALPTISKHLTRGLLRLRRGDLRKAVAVLTGHCSLNKHFHTLGLTDSPLCRGCLKEEETPAHVTIHCEGVDTQRTAIIGRIGSLQEASRDISALLAFWKEDYAINLAKQTKPINQARNKPVGRDLDPSLLDHMTDDQIVQLYELHKAANNEEDAHNEGRKS